MYCYKNKIAKTIALLFIANSLFAETWILDGNGNWGDGSNWNTGTVPNSNTVMVDFNTAITAPRTISVNGTFSALALDFQNAKAYTLSGGTIDLYGSVTMVAPTASHEIKSNLDLKANVTANIPAGSPFTISGDISGSQSLQKLGAGTLVLTGNNSYSGSTVVNNGVLEGTTDGIQGGIQNNSTVSFNQSTTGTFGNIIAGGGILQKKGTGTLIFAGTNAVSEVQFLGGAIQTNNVASTLNTGTLRFNGGELKITAVDAFSNPITLDGNGTIHTDGVNVSYTGAIGGNGRLIKTGSGSFDLGANPHGYSGGTQINGGTLIANNGGNLGSGGITFNGGTLNTTAGLTVSQSGALQSGGGIIDVSAGTTTWSGNIQDDGALTKAGSGTLLLTGNNSYRGGTLVSQGTLEGTTTSLQRDINNNDTVNFNQASTGTYSGNITGSGTVNINGGGSVTFSGSNSYSGPTNIVSGTLTGTTNSLQRTINNSDSLIFNQSFNGNFRGSLSGNGTLTKNGSGTVSVSGTQLMTGLTTIAQGTLSLNGSLGGDVQVNSGGTLSGNATTQNLTNNGTVSPGNSIGVINVLGNYAQGSGGNLVIEVDQDGNSDELIITGTADLDGTLTAAPQPGLYSGDEVYTFLYA